MKRKTVKHQILFLIIFKFVTGCSSSRNTNQEQNPNRHPAFDPSLSGKVISSTELQNLYLSIQTERNAASQLAESTNTPLETSAKHQYEKNQKLYSEAVSEKNKNLKSIDEKILNGYEPPNSFEVSQWSDIKTDKLVIPSIKTLKKGLAKTFLLGPSSFEQYGVEIINYAFSNQLKEIRLKNKNSKINTFEENIDEELISKSFFNVELSCDAEFKIQQNKIFQNEKSKNKIEFKLFDSQLNAQKIIFFPSSAVTSCQMKFQDKDTLGRKKEIIKMERLDKKFPKLVKLMNSVEICRSPKMDSENVGTLKNLFQTNKYDNMTCANSIDNARLLSEGTDGIAAKIEVLLGQKLPSNFIDNGDPFAPLDFSKAPILDGIVLSYLNIRSDFSGVLLTRLLDFHARGSVNKMGKVIRPGTPVFIYVSEVTSLDKDKNMLQDLALRNGNIKLIEYRWMNTFKSGLGSFIDYFHRTNHVKIFATLSEQNAKDNVVILGGRNVHDGFVFKNPIFSIYPTMVQYGEGKDDKWVVFRDLEAMFVSDSFAKQIFRHYFHLYYKNSETFNMQSPSLTVFQNEQDSIHPEYFNHFSNHIDFGTNKMWVRHFISVPFKDGHTLTELYADMIHAAKKKILITSPYFRPNKTIQKALEQAVDRGVEVKLVTRLDLKGDTFGGIASDVNKQGVNSFLGKIKMYEYAEPKEILHSKLLLIDDEFTFIGGVNLNKRSFEHDTENGLIIGSAVFNQAVISWFNQYVLQSKEITKEQKVLFWRKWIIDIIDKKI